MSKLPPITKNGEILFIYDAEMCNPNGDPDNENKPRMDMPKSTNLVSDLRLKRYIRDYLERYEKMEIYVSNPEDQVLNAGDRLKFWIWRKANPTAIVDVDKARKTDIKKLTKEEVKNAFIDVRLFGATIPIKSEEGGSSIKYIGPVQLNWGKSFNEVEFVESSGITSHFSSSEGKQGTMGTDYRLFYSLLGFHGVISANRAKETDLTDTDIAALDKAFIKSIPQLVTRSKINQYPRLYLRIQFLNSENHMEDLRKFVTLTNKKGLRSISDVKIDFSKLIEKIDTYADKIDTIYYWDDEKIGFDFSKSKIKTKFKKLTF